ncbi:MAG TPA: Flp family type IVb pilin [Solirubrobacteraceae bacterium]|nr:Flp family type IVb pilin [Solirubrobacteraceae bacterium]
MEYLRNTLKREEGQTMVEYGLIIALVSVVAIVALTAVGVNLSAIFTDIAGELGV